MATKFDLSFDEVVLDYEALRKLALIATRRSLWDVQRALGKTGDLDLLQKSCAHLCSVGKELREAAEDLEYALAAYGYLNDGLSRSKITVIRDAKQSCLDKTLEKWDVPQV